MCSFVIAHLVELLYENCLSLQVKPLLNVARAEEEMKEREEEVKKINSYVNFKHMET